ncbi:hypothetical protein B4102_2142 [Heyndrickxia sporothermodurans]|uniref:Uncharacterized protein n=1 Tax=Heyndrickxia sporothermodurans TaxID=46224 RepID=A0A150LGP6_9BACI|nr:hypothetical protein [Heyndrickxia sporothermodurans]KYD11414.1 hypothetical protein B4102_2142 [Heyndrickxia sporothermodurans]
MENNKDSKSRKPGLIRQSRVIPTIPDQSDGAPQIDNQQKDTIKQEAIKRPKKNLNQQSNIKVSKETKKQIEILLNFSHHKFAYELIDSMINVYVDNALEDDQKRAFRTLVKLSRSTS